MRYYLLILITAIIAAIAIVPSTASAHARLKTSTPAVGEVVQTAPTQVVIFFTQEIQKVSGLYSINVNRDRGAEVTTGPAVIDESDRTKMSVQLQPDLGPGRYVVHWHNVSDADGDPLDGAFSFYVQTQPNAVDLANDADLAKIGNEDVTPAAEGSATAGTASVETPSSGPTSAPATSAPATGSAATIQSAVTATPESSGASSGGSSNTTVYVIIAVLAVAAIGAAGAWWFFARRSS
jgi:methionine-rich copper-binding protein CopC